MVELAFSGVDFIKEEKKNKIPDLLSYKENIIDILEDDIVQKNKLIQKKKYKKNYEEKIKIIENPNIDISKLRDKKLIIKNKKAETMINKAIILENLEALEKKRDKSNIPEEIRKKNREEIQKELHEDGLTNNSLDSIGKILRGTRFNFYGIIIEEGHRKDFFYENSDGTIKRSNKEIKGAKNCIIDPNKKVLVRHLEGTNIQRETMRKALKEGVSLYEECFSEYMKEVKYLTSGSWLWNKDFREFYEKITGEKSNTHITREWTEKIGGKFIERKDIKNKNENDRFILLKGIAKNKKTKKINQIKKRIINNQKITGDPTVEETKNLVDARNKRKNQPKINKFHIARAIYGPISSTICLLPIENIKKVE